MATSITRRFLLTAFTAVSISGLVYVGFKVHEGLEGDRQKSLLSLSEQGVMATPMQVRKSAKEGDVKMLETLGELDVDFDSVGSDGRDAVHLAMDHSKWDALEVVRKHVQDQDSKDAQGKTPLKKLLSKGYLNLAQNFVDSGAEVDFKVEVKGGEVPASVYFLQEEEWDKFHFAIDNAADLGSCDLEGRGLLQMALEGGYVEVAEKLIKYGAETNDLKLSGRNGAVELLENPEKYDLDADELTNVLAAMIQGGLDVETVDEEGDSLLTIAMRDERMEVFELLMQHVDKDEAHVWKALDFRRSEMLDALLQRGQKADIKNEMGETPLVTMARQGGDGAAEVVSVLLDNGADANQLTETGQRVLFDAMVAGKPEVAQMLINHPMGADVHEPMSYPVSQEFRGLYENKGLLDWYCRNIRELSPLMVAVLSDQLYVAEDLIKKGAKRNQRTHVGSFPIQMAAGTKNVRMQQLILGVPFEDEEQERHYIIDLSDQKVYFFKNGKIVKTSTCSTGRKGYRTPVGKYVVTDRQKDKVSNIYKDAKMPYFQRFSCSDFGVHQGATYAGYLSHGCIRLPMSNAKYFFTHGKVGDRVTIRK